MTQTITLISPTDLAQLRKHEPVIVSVTDTAGLGAVSVWTKFDSLRDWDAVFVDAELSPRYEDAGSVVAETVAGITKVFTLLRRDGWPSNEQTDVALPLRIYFNEAVVTNHATTHELDGTDQVAGQKLRIATTFTPVWTAATDGSSANNVAMLGAHLKGISTYLTSLASTVSGHTSSLATLSSSVSTNTSAIATNTTSISTNTSDIAALQTLAHDDISSGTTSYNLINGDALRKKRTLATTTFTLNVRTQATHVVTVDKPQFWRSAAAGAISIVPAGGVTLNGASATLTVPAGKAVAITRISSDAWDVEGNFS